MRGISEWVLLVEVGLECEIMLWIVWCYYDFDVVVFVVEEFVEALRDDVVDVDAAGYHGLDAFEFACGPVSVK